MFNDYKEDERQDAWIRQKYQEEAARIEKETASVTLEENELDKSQLLVKILAAVNDEPAPMPVKKSRRPIHIVAKWAAVFALVLVGVFGTAMTSQGNRLYVLQFAERLMGQKPSTIMDNEKERYYTDTSEEEARNDIAEKLNCPVPTIMALPEGMKFSKYSVVENSGYGYMEYSYKDYSVFFYIYNSKSNASRYALADGKVIDQQKRIMDKIDVATYIVEDQEGPLHRVQWEYENHFYMISGYLELEELYQMLDNIRY